MASSLWASWRSSFYLYFSSISTMSDRSWLSPSLSLYSSVLAVSSLIIESLSIIADKAAYLICESSIDKLELSCRNDSTYSVKATVS